MEKLTTLAHTHYQTEDRVSYEHFIEADTEFHIGIAQLTRNRLLVRAVTDVRCQMERIMFAAIDIGYYGEVPAREHTEMLEAIRRRDAGAARRLMYDHIVGSKATALLTGVGLLPARQHTLLGFEGCDQDRKSTRLNSSH